ncbi:uncharacterized protein LOC127261714 [Andrographis paniculata]|uniref:uncharacterized protein LOC127261714 n=1 Tax=Andrographis paniculata TaxID=175694 RepID=UPI0021E75A1E|nr:uncharacterized protein LOC127261714 [Andrographis paniculata]
MFNYTNRSIELKNCSAVGGTKILVKNAMMVLILSSFEQKTMKRDKAFAASDDIVSIYNMLQEGYTINIVKVFFTAATVPKAALIHERYLKCKHSVSLSTSSQSTGHSRISFVTRNCHVCSL